MTDKPPQEHDSQHGSNFESELDDLAHALRSPLTALRGGLEMLNESSRAGLDEAGIRGLDVALSATRRLTALVDDTLLLARIRAGRLDLSMSVVTAGDLAREVLQRHPDSHERLRYRVESDAEKVEIAVDVDLLATVITRLARALPPTGEPVTMRVLCAANTAVFELTSPLPFYETDAYRPEASALEACRAVTEQHRGDFETGTAGREIAGTLARITFPAVE